MLKNLALLLVASLLSFAGLEGALRMIMPERLAYVPTLLNNELTYVPHQSERSRHLEWDYDVVINADGFRNDKTVDALGANSILALGDSFTEGYGVALDDSFAKQLERSAGLDVYNAGHYDTGLPTYRRVYHEIFSKVPSIDRVIIGVFVGNDVLRTAKPPDGRLAPGNEFGDGWRYKLKVFLGSHIATYAALNYTIKTNPTLLKLCQSMGACYTPRPPNIYAGSAVAELVRHTATFTERFVGEIRADDRTALVVIIPTREQVDDELWTQALTHYGADANDNRFAVNEQLAKTLRAGGIAVLDLTAAAVAHQRETGEKLYYQYDGHWNPAGHRFAAEHLRRFLNARGGY